MTVSCYFGLTESGKSYHVQKNVIPAWKKSIIFDPARCFEDGYILEEPNDDLIMKLYQKLRHQSSYRLIFRPMERGTRLSLFNRMCEFAFILGERMGKGISKDERIQLVVDEADSICSPYYKSDSLHHLVNEARHDNVDSHFIARAPMRIHPDIRANVTNIVSFRLKNAQKNDYFREMFGDEHVGKIKNLPKYWRMEADEKGDVFIFNDKNKIHMILDQNSTDFKSKKGKHESY